MQSSSRGVVAAFASKTVVEIPTSVAHRHIKCCHQLSEEQKNNPEFWNETNFVKQHWNPSHLTKQIIPHIETSGKNTKVFLDDDQLFHLFSDLMVWARASLFRAKKAEKALQALCEVKPRLGTHITYYMSKK